jgi:hypothetical protein
VGHLSVAAKTGLANPAILGRHSAADLCIQRDMELSLRHLVVVLHPLRVGDDQVCFRVLDLRSQAGYHDERGHQRRALRAPMSAEEPLLAPDEQPLGKLEMRTDQGVQNLFVGSRASRDGILLGRSERCDGDTRGVMSNNELSRVHLLAVDQQLYAIDTASTNGTYKDEREVRIVPFNHGDELLLGNVVHVRWLAVSTRH